MMKETIVPIFLSVLISLLIFVGIFFTACTLKNPDLWRDLLECNHYCPIEDIPGKAAEESRQAAYIDSY